MGEVQQRLIRCFSAVFPQLPADQICSASVKTVAEWDSLAAVTLMAILQEEFAVEIDLDDLTDLTSFPAVLRYLESRTVSNNGHM